LSIHINITIIDNGTAFLISVTPLVFHDRPNGRAQLPG
jgi:hypothetical protein